jgi:hypothetical protein
MLSNQVTSFPALLLHYQAHWVPTPALRYWLLLSTPSSQYSLSLSALEGTTSWQDLEFSRVAVVMNIRRKSSQGKDPCLGCPPSTSFLLTPLNKFVQNGDTNTQSCHSGNCWKQRKISSNPSKTSFMRTSNDIYRVCFLSQKCNSTFMVLCKVKRLGEWNSVISPPLLDFSSRSQFCLSSFNIICLPFHLLAWLLFLYLNQIITWSLNLLYTY